MAWASVISSAALRSGRSMERYAAFCGGTDDRQEFLPMPGEEAVEQRPVSAKEIHQIVALLFDAIPPGHILHMPVRPADRSSAPPEAQFRQGQTSLMKRYKKAGIRLTEACSLLLPAGIEPALHRWNGILSPARLPIPPWQHFDMVFLLQKNGPSGTLLEPECRRVHRLVYYTPDPRLSNLFLSRTKM